MIDHEKIIIFAVNKSVFHGKMNCLNAKIACFHEQSNFHENKSMKHFLFKENNEFS